jgi:predicted small lipoprotein YifL
MRVTFSVVAAILLLAACGQKGPLYLPDANGTVVTRPTQSQPTNTQPTSPQPQTQTPAQSPQPVDAEKERKNPPK